MPLTREELVEAFRTMRLIRAFEEAIRRLHGAGELPGFMHVSVGQEAVPVGISLRLRRDDLITTTHRGHGDMIAKVSLDSPTPLSEDRIKTILTALHD